MAAVTDLGRIVGMAGTGAVPEIVIVPGTGVGIADDGGDGGTAGHIAHQTGEELRAVRFFPGGGGGAAARRTPVQKGLQFVKIDGKACRDSLHGHTDGRGMGLSKYRKT